MSHGWPERLPLPTGNKRNHTELEHLERYRWAAARVSGAVLDAACGTGYGTAMLSQRAKVIGVDHAAEAVAVAQRAAPTATVVQAKLPQLNFVDDSFDHVVSFETIEHVDRDREFIEEVRRVLKPRGSLLISTPNGANPLGNTLDENPWHQREYSLDEFQALLQNAGFTALEVYQQRVPNFSANPALTQVRRAVARFPALCRPGYWWDTIAHGSPYVEPWGGSATVFFWIVRASAD